MIAPDDPRHGTKAGYHAHRRAGEDACQACTDAAARYERARQLDLLNGTPRLVPSIGAQRRLQALVALGHTWQVLATELGHERTNLRRLAMRPAGVMTSRLARQIHDLYERWSMRLPEPTTGQGRRRVAEAHALAERHGWRPPLAWEGLDIDDPLARPDRGRRRGRGHDDVDEVLVTRILAGDTELADQATTAERRLIVAAWPRADRSLRDLAAATGWRPDRYRTTPTTKENTAA